MACMSDVPIAEDEHGLDDGRCSMGRRGAFQPPILLINLFIQVQDVFMLKFRISCSSSGYGSPTGFALSCALVSRLMSLDLLTPSPPLAALTSAINHID